MSHKLTDEQIKELLQEREELLVKIRDAKKFLKNLETEDKNIKCKIFNGCNHNWKKEIEYCQYGERYYICTKCRFIK